ncbi:hypothetical protein [Spirillospora sp. NBC_01491]|uniref:hypothetical protein n=1 Tax=Spirillospora sp. NBC_01491 TaxID=2976007 RepID=UPI002E362C63|nr:hypothetical protein [Spirillospora sp. NBC_01491]
MPGAGGAPDNGAAGAGGGMTVGTITRIEGNTVYLRTSSGQTVMVKTSGSTKIRVTKAGTVKDLSSGAGLVVSGTTAEDGSVIATAIGEGTRPGRGN